MNTRTGGHRRFAATWNWLTAHEGPKQRAARERVVSPLKGRVLEIGFGVGTNWAYLPEGVEYVGIEPDPYMIARARRHAAAVERSLELHQARAEALPFEDASFDAVFTTLTFCTVQDVPAALREVQRVLKPGAEFHFWEHVRPRGRVLGPLSDLVTPVWRNVGGGCNPNRRTTVALRKAGFEFVSFQRVSAPPLPMVFGRAVVAAEAPAEVAPILESAPQG
ncbi:MAG: class I SAM-dependent methyltransferase [Dehalococcoidia bacterium]|nr:class I SAM-dependent methyltransferase [Dehalococcoidia bacterium]